MLNMPLMARVERL